MGCKYRVMDKCYAKDNIKDAFCFGKDGCPYYEKKVETIPQSDYENRLKADMVAMLTELQLEIEEMSGLVTEIHGEEWNEINVIHSQDVLSFIQQKINELKTESEDKE